MRLRAGLLLVLATCAVWPVLRIHGDAQSVPPRTVLMIHLGSETFPANPILDAGVREVFAAQSDIRIAYYAEYLESDLFERQEAALALKEYIKRKYADRTIDAVLVNTDRARRFVLDNRAELFGDAPVVFSGLTVPDDAARSAGGGITGIQTGIAYAQTLKFALALHPAVQQVYVIANSEDPATNEAARAQFKGFSGLTFTYLTEPGIPDLLSAVRSIPQGSLLLYIWQGDLRPGSVVYADEVARQVARESPVPVYGTSDFYIGSGVVGGVVRSTRGTGNRLASIALRILSGARAQDIPIETSRVAPFVDWRQIRRWKLAASALPADTQILFRDPTTWERYRPYILAAAIAFAAQAFLIGALLVQRGRARRADAALRRSYARVRDLGARLLNAQEDERSRIARELHDDISQRLAVLKIELTLIRRSVTSDAESLMAQALARADSLAIGIRELSHRLHPSRLRLMGLAPSIAGLKTELSRPGVDITFTHEALPGTLAPDVTLSLFRVAQEALNNALKYSEASTIAIDLRGTDRDLVLTIVDNGVGFEMDAATGLGLTSMRERVDALGGRLQIRTAPGRGTAIEVRVPVVVARSGAIAV